MNVVSVQVVSTDPVLRRGLEAQFWGRQEVDLVSEDPVGASTAGQVASRTEVALFAGDVVDDGLVQLIRMAQRSVGCPCVVVASDFDTKNVLAAAEAGASGFLRRTDATPERLVETVGQTVRGNGALPDDLLGRLLESLGRLQEQYLGPKGVSLEGLTEREIDILRLLADGRNTSEISEVLCYSERTVKNTIHGLLARFNLKNRSHAVAFAMRLGLI